MEYKLGNIISATSAFEEANTLAPEDVDVWLQWSLVYFEQGDITKATDIISDGLNELPDNADLFYRMAIYLLDSGKVKEAFNYLENALILNFDGHKVLFDFFPNADAQKALYKIINQFKQD
jgi:tetratricopeptide (TPR) repeat protein